MAELSLPLFVLDFDKCSAVNADLNNLSHIEFSAKSIHLPVPPEVHYELTGQAFRCFDYTGLGFTGLVGKAESERLHVHCFDKQVSY